MNLSFYTDFSPAISSNIHRCFNNTFHGFKIMKNTIITETFNVGFHYKFIKFFMILFFSILRSPTGVEHPGEKNYGCHSHNAKLFK